MGIGQYHLAHRFTTQRFQINVLYWCRVSKGPQNALKKGQIGLKWIGVGQFGTVLEVIKFKLYLFIVTKI